MFDKKSHFLLEKTKGIVNVCLNRVGPDLISSCIGGFHSIVEEILDKGESTIDMYVYSFFHEVFLYENWKKYITVKLEKLSWKLSS